jgi:hypothetical protein
LGAGVDVAEVDLKRERIWFMRFRFLSKTATTAKFESLPLHVTLFAKLVTAEGVLKAVKKLAVDAMDTVL